MKIKILIALILIILTVGTVSASDNTTSIGEADEVNDIIASSDNQELLQDVKSAQKLNVTYEIKADEEYVEGSGFEGDFNIEMYDREFLNGNLKIYIDDELKYSKSPAIDYGSRDGDWESDKYPNSYCILDINFLDRLGLAYGLHKAEFKYSGDTLFNDFSETRYFNYTYIKFYVPEDVNEYGSTCRFYVESTAATGDLKILLDNRTIHDGKFTGYDYIDLDELTFGTHTYDIYFTGNGKFKSIHKNGTFIRTYPFDVFLDDDEGKLPINNNGLNIYLPEDAESNVTVVVNNKTYSATLKYGEGKVEITSFNIGENIIYITYCDETYPERTISRNVTVLPSLYFTYSKSRPQENDAKARLVMCENAKGTLKIDVDGENYTCDLINGTATVPLDMVKAGKHDFHISYTGDYEEYFQNKTYENIIIEEMEIITIDESDITLELPKGENGTLSVTINKNSETIKVENTTYFVHPLNLDKGVWDIKVTYNGNSITKTKTAKLDTRTRYFELACDDFYFKDSHKEAYLDYYDGFNLKRVTVTIDNKKQKISSYGEIDLSKLAAGKHTIAVTYKNSKNEVLQTVKKTFTISTYSYPKFELKDTQSKELNNGKYVYRTLSLSDDTTLIMDVNLNCNVKGSVTVYKTFINYYNDYSDELDETVIGKYKSFSINNGKARLTIPTKILNSTYSMKLSVTLSDKNTINSSFVTYWQPKVEHPLKMTYGENKTLTIYIPGKDNVTIGMFGYFKPVYSKIINGKAQFSLSTLPIRNGMPVTFIYSQNEYDGKSPYQELHPEYYNLKLNVLDKIQKINMYYNDGTTYSLKVSKIYGKEVKKGQTVKFKIGTKSINVKTDKNGVAKLKIPNTIKPGTYTLTTTYKYSKISKKLTVKHVVSLKTVKVKKYAKKLVLTATLKGKKVLKNQKVTFKFNGKTYKAKTNTKGVANVIIKKSVLNKLKAGKKITYQATYLKDTVKKTVKVQR